MVKTARSAVSILSKSEVKYMWICMVFYHRYPSKALMYHTCYTRDHSFIATKHEPCCLYSPAAGITASIELCILLANPCHLQFLPQLAITGRYTVSISEVAFKGNTTPFVAVEADKLGPFVRYCFDSPVVVCY